jgi:Cu(I)/Ag(I) efflux system membrane fusion protein
MDMQLVPVYADEANGAGVAVSAGVAQNLGIRTVLVRKADVSTSLDLTGVVAPNERATEVVQSRVTGFIEKLHVRAVFDPVRKGQALATIHAPDWAAALEEYLGIRRAQVGQPLVDAARARLRLLSIPDGVVAASEQSGQAQSRFTLTAPVSGVVAELGARDGAMVSPGMTLFRIVDLGSIWVLASLPEALAGQVRPGAIAEVRIAGAANAIAGRISAILPEVDAGTRTVKARVEMPNPGQMLKPGMFVRVFLKPAAVEEVLVVPQEAVITTGKRSVVIVAADGGKYSPVEVRLGRESGADIEVRSGLTEGQKVVASGQFLLDSEASLKSGLPRLDTAPAKSAASVGYAAEGKVEAIDKDGMTISHGPIPALKWGSMTMAFKLPPGGVPKGLKVGARIHFEFVQQGDDYVLQHVMPMPGGGKP